MDHHPNALPRSGNSHGFGVPKTGQKLMVFMMVFMVFKNPKLMVL